MAEDNRHSPTPTPAGVPSPWEKRFPDDTVAVEKNKVTAAAFGLVLMAVVQILIGILHMPMSSIEMVGRNDLLHFLVPEHVSEFWGFTLFATATLALVCSAVLARSPTMLVALVALVAAAAGFIVLVIVGHWIGAIVSAGTKLLVLNAVLSLRRIKHMVWEEAERNPLVAHYRLLVRLLVRMMAVDRHVDRREAETIMRICNSLRISKDAQRQFVEEALDEVEDEESDLEPHARRYLELAEEAGIPHPQRTALMAAVAVASADGVIGDAEEDELHSLGSSLELDKGEVSRVIAQHRASLNDLTPELARQLLNVESTASSLELEEAYRAVIDDLQLDDYDHLGEGLVDYADQRRAIVERAFELLKG